MNPLTHVYFKEMSKALHANPRLSEEEVEESVFKGLRHFLTADQIDKLKDELNAMGTEFAVHGVINPHFLRTALGKVPYLFLVDAREGLLPVVEALARDVRGDASRYVVYAEKDVIILLWGTDIDCLRLSQRLEELELSVEALPIESSPYFKGYEVADWVESAQEVDELALNRFATSYRQDEAQERKLRSAYEEAGVLLGPTLVEDLSKTLRLQAFIGVSLKKHVPNDIRTNFAQVLLDMDSVCGVLRSVHQCAPAAFNYVLEVICDDHVVLDQVTDELNSRLQRVYKPMRVETSTYIVAKAYEILPKYTREEAGDVLSTTEWPEMGILRQLKHSYLATEPKPIQRAYAGLESGARVDLLMWLREMTVGMPWSLEDKQSAKVKKGLSQFVGGVVTRSPDALHDAMKTLATGRPSVESASRNAASRLIGLFYNSYYKEAQRVLKLSTSKAPENYTLGECGLAFSKINENDLYRRIGVRFPHDFLSRFERFTRVRNYCVHATDIPADWSDFDSLAYDIRQGFIDGVFIMTWLNDNVLGRDFSMVPIELVLNPPEETKGDAREILRKVADEIAAIETRLEGMEAAHRADFETVILRLNMIPTKEDHQPLFDLAAALVERREEIIASVEVAGQPAMKSRLDLLRENMGQLSVATLASLTAQIIVMSGPSVVGTLLQLAQQMLSS